MEGFYNSFRHDVAWINNITKIRSVMTSIWHHYLTKNVHNVSSIIQASNVVSCINVLHHNDLNKVILTFIVVQGHRSRSNVLITIKSGSAWLRAVLTVCLQIRRNCGKFKCQQSQFYIISFSVFFHLYICIFGMNIKS